MTRIHLLAGCGRVLRKQNLDLVVVRNLSLSPPIALKSNLPIKWYRPEKIPCIHAAMSGDLEPVMKLNLNERSPLEFQDSDELKTADETVKRLFTLEFFPSQKAREVLNAEYVSAVKRHALDANSPEARIAKMTAKVRVLQAAFEKFPQNKVMKVKLKEAIDKRKRLLLELREQDYKCFEFLLEKLNLEYKPQPPPEVHMRVERKRSLRMLTKEYCDNIIKAKMDSYKSQLDARKESFLKNKVETLKWIMKTEKECGTEPTVTEDDISVAEKRLKDFQESINVKKNEDE